MYLILAVEPAKLHDAADITFDRHYTRSMRLPFRRGWHHWSVYCKEKSILVHLTDFDTYLEAERFVRAARRQS